MLHGFHINIFFYQFIFHFNTLLNIYIYINKLPQSVTLKTIELYNLTISSDCVLYATNIKFLSEFHKRRLKKELTRTLINYY